MLQKSDRYLERKTFYIGVFVTTVLSTISLPPENVIIFVLVFPHHAVNAVDRQLY